MFIADRYQQTTESYERVLKLTVNRKLASASANDIDYYKEFILRGRSLICIMNNTGRRIDPWRTPCFVFSSQRKHFELYDFTSTFCFLLVK